MNIKRNIILSAAIVIALLFAWRCEDDSNYIDYEKLESSGTDLYNRFMALDSAVRDTLYAKVRGKNSLITKIDDRDTTGLLMYITHRSGETDSVISGAYVGIRYIYWGIFENDNGNIDVDTMFLNRYDDDPTVFMVDNYTSTYYISSGINRGVKFMKPFDRAIMVLPYSIGAQTIFGSTSDVGAQYTPIIADVEITYWTDR